MRVIEPGKGRVRIGVAGNRTRVELRDDETPVGTFELDTRSLVRLENALDNGLDDDLILPSGRLLITWRRPSDAVQLAYTPNPRTVHGSEFDVQICAADAIQLRNNLLATPTYPPRAGN